MTCFRTCLENEFWRIKFFFPYPNIKCQDITTKISWKWGTKKERRTKISCEISGGNIQMIIIQCHTKRQKKLKSMIMGAGSYITIMIAMEELGVDHLIIFIINLNFCNFFHCQKLQSLMPTSSLCFRRHHWRQLCQQRFQAAHWWCYSHLLLLVVIVVHKLVICWTHDATRLEPPHLRALVGRHGGARLDVWRRWWA